MDFTRGGENCGSGWNFDRDSVDFKGDEWFCGVAHVWRVEVFCKSIPVMIPQTPQFRKVKNFAGPRAAVCRGATRLLTFFATCAILRVSFFLRMVASLLQDNRCLAKKVNFPN